MYVESVNVGVPSVAEWKGRTFATSIINSPVAGRVAVRGVNLAGDDRADRSVHGGPDKAVYAYSREDIDWWTQSLGRPLVPGRDFGENLTTVSFCARKPRALRFGKTGPDRRTPDGIPCIAGSRKLGSWCSNGHRSMIVGLHGEELARKPRAAIEAHH